LGSRFVSRRDSKVFHRRTYTYRVGKENDEKRKAATEVESWKKRITGERERERKCAWASAFKESRCCCILRERFEKGARVIEKMFLYYYASAIRTQSCPWSAMWYENIAENCFSFEQVTRREITSSIISRYDWQCSSAAARMKLGRVLPRKSVR
jgi:hypothetical protein